MNVFAAAARARDELEHVTGGAHRRGVGAGDRMRKLHRDPFARKIRAGRRERQPALPFEYAIAPATRPLCGPQMRRLDGVIDAVATGRSKSITMLALRATLIALPPGAVALTAIACGEPAQ